MTNVGPSGTRVAAFFDLDGTLIPGSANIPLAKAAFRAGFVSKRELALDLARNVSFMLRGPATTARPRSATGSCAGSRVTRPVRSSHWPTGFLDDLVADDHPDDACDPRRAPVAAGHDLVLVSASHRDRPAVCGGGGMDYGRGTTAGRDAEGRFDGTLSGPFCYKEGKAEVIADLAADARV
jgi:phosphoserine phosphatase